MTDPEYRAYLADERAQLAKLGQSVEAMSEAYHAKVAEMAVAAIKAGTPLSELPPELAAIVAQARDASEGVNPADVPEAARPFIVLGKILLAVLSAL
jgi:hypothetical protein